MSTDTSLRPELTVPGGCDELYLEPYVDFDITDGTKASEVDLHVFEPRVVALARYEMEESHFDSRAIQDAEGSVVGVRLPYQFARELGRVGLPKYFGGEGVIDEHTKARQALVVACVFVQGMVQKSTTTQGLLPTQRTVTEQA